MPGSRCRPRNISNLFDKVGMRRVVKLAPAFAGALLLNGCFFSRVFDQNASNPTVYGAQPLTAVEDSTPLDLPKLIDPDVPSPVFFEKKSKPSSVPSTTAVLDPIFSLFNSGYFRDPDYPKDDRLFSALEKFDSLPDEIRKNRRAEIQEALIVKSSSLCSLYKKGIMQVGAEQNLLLGDATTLASGLAAIFSRLGTIRPLAGGAAVLSGFRSEFNSDVFANLNLQVITAGIEKRRSDYYAAILKTRSCTIQEYPLLQAIKDAYYLHNSCSLYAGLEEANLSIKQAQSPGLDELADSLKKLNSIVASQRAAFGGQPLSTSPPRDAGSSTAAPEAVIANFSVSPTTQRVSSSCELPVPGTPKSSIQTTLKASVTMADGNVVALPFTDASDPVLGLNMALKQISDELDVLKKQASSTAPAAVTALEAKKNATVKQLNDNERAPAQAAMTAYGMALVAFEAVTVDDTSYSAKLSALYKAQVDNTRIMVRVQKAVDDYEKSDEMAKVKLAIATAK